MGTEDAEFSVRAYALAGEVFGHIVRQVPKTCAVCMKQETPRVITYTCELSVDGSWRMICETVDVLSLPYRSMPMQEVARKFAQRIHDYIESSGLSNPAERR